MNSPVVINMYGWPDPGTGPAGQSRGALPGGLPEGFPHAAHAAALARAPRLQPHQVHAEFPERWRAYIRAMYRDYREVTQAFGVCERTARKWWEGESGVNGGYVAVAMRTHPQEAAELLFADAA